MPKRTQWKLPRSTGIMPCLSPSLRSKIRRSRLRSSWSMARAGRRRRRRSHESCSTIFYCRTTGGRRTTMRNQSLPQRLHIDLPLILGLLALCSLGLVILYSASGMDRDVMFRQMGRMLLAFGLMLLFAQIQPAQLARWSLWVYLAGVVLLILVLVSGDISKGARRWLDLGIVRFQPSEVMKL